MVTRAKPDASFASTNLAYYSGPHLLSQAGGKSLRYDTRYQASTKEEPKSPTKLLREPATDDDPLSDSDENEDSQSSSRDDVEYYAAKTTLAEKLAEIEKRDTTVKNGKRRPEASPRQGVRKSVRQRASSRKDQSPKRPLNDFLDEKDDDPFPFMSSQSSKRRRTLGYGGKHAHGPSPSYGMSTSSLPDSSPLGKLSQGFQESKVSEADIVARRPQGSDDGFRVPIEIEVNTPLSKHRTRSKAQPSKDEGSSPVEFRMPRVLGDVAAYSSQEIGFKEPPGLSLSSVSLGPTKDYSFLYMDDGESISPLSSVTSNMFLDLSQEEKAFVAAEKASESATPNEFLCPMCKEPVEPDLLIKFQAQANQRVREQQRFCDSHKRRSAEKQWHEKGYPQIDWENFEERIRGHFPALEKILNPEYSSFYRNILDTTMKAGKAKNFRLTISGDGLDNMSCGYYGSKGASKMCVFASLRFTLRGPSV
jgi:hypothetical protein